MNTIDPRVCVCGAVLIPGVSRALVISDDVIFCRACVLSWTPPKPTPLERRAGRNWPQESRCRMAS